jgi:hypothetical protein
MMTVSSKSTLEKDEDNAPVEIQGAAEETQTAVDEVKVDESRPDDEVTDSTPESVEAVSTDAVELSTKESSNDDISNENREEEKDVVDIQEEEEEEEGDGENSDDDFILSVVPKNIGLSRYAYNWFQKSDPASVDMALKKLILLAEGPIAWKRSRQLSKVLEGQKYTPTKFPIREAKLDRGMRILWQECSALGEGSGGGAQFAAASGSILIWYVTKHDFISARMLDIDRCFMRMNVTSNAFDAAFSGGAVGQNDLRHTSVPEVLLDPRGNTPLLVYDVMVHELPQLTSRWTPPMRLTSKEEAIVRTDGLVTIIGRRCVHIFSSRALIYMPSFSLFCIVFFLCHLQFKLRCHYSHIFLPSPIFPCLSPPPHTHTHTVALVKRCVSLCVWTAMPKLLPMVMHFNAVFVKCSLLGRARSVRR